jgi:ABC-2 type transport system permease protein
MPTPMPMPTPTPTPHPMTPLPLAARLAPLRALSVARVKEFLREPGALFWTFGFPLLITIALGIAFRDQKPPRAAVALVRGSAAATAQWESLLAADPALAVRVLSPADAAAELRAGSVVLAIEPGARTGDPIVYRFDPSRPDALATRRLVDDWLQRRAGRVDPIPTRDETSVARGARYIDWLVPGLLGLQLVNGALWGTAWNIVNARQRKLLKRLAATPMRRRHYLLSFRVSGLLFVPVQVIVLFVFARLTFGVTVHGSILAVFALSILASWSFAGLGLLCASRAQNNETANGLINLVNLPMFVLAGVFFSSSRFPAFVQPAIRLLPLTAFNESLRHVVNDGASIAAQGPQILTMVVWGTVSATVALRIFRWR